MVGMYYCLAVVNRGTDTLVPYKAGNFLASYDAVSFSTRNIFHEDYGGWLAGSGYVKHMMR
jgi:hypothetical protein